MPNTPQWYLNDCSMTSPFLSLASHTLQHVCQWLTTALFFFHQSSKPQLLRGVDCKTKWPVLSHQHTIKGMESMAITRFAAYCPNQHTPPLAFNSCVHVDWRVADFFFNIWGRGHLQYWLHCFRLPCEIGMSQVGFLKERLHRCVWSVYSCP